jgi:hypothetical protein
MTTCSFCLSKTHKIEIYVWSVFIFFVNFKTSSIYIKKLKLNFNWVVLIKESKSQFFNKKYLRCWLFITCFYYSYLFKLKEDNRALWNKKLLTTKISYRKRFFSYFSISDLALESKNREKNLFQYGIFVVSSFLFHRALLSSFN